MVQGIYGTVSAILRRRCSHTLASASGIRFGLLVPNCVPISWLYRFTVDAYADWYPATVEADDR